MKELVVKIYNKVGIKSDRTKNIAKHIGWSTFYKIGSILANFLLVPLTINYLDTTNYGVWLTLSSFISWFSFFDIGLGNGLRNKFAEAKSLGNYKDAQALVSTAYFTIGTISSTVILIFLILNQFINWTQLFNTDSELENVLSVLLPIIFAFFGLQLVVKLITNIYQADQNHSIQGKIQFFGQALSLITIWLLTKTDKSSLIIFGSIFTALPVLILVGLNLFAFKTRFKDFKPKFSLWKKEYLKEITGLGFKFFIVQIAAMILFSTDNFIISKLFGPEEVVPYNIAFKYFSIVTMGYTILITPYWSSFTEAYAEKDFQWIKKSVSNIQKIWLIIPIGLVAMVLLSNWFYKLWIGQTISISFNLTLGMAFYVLILTWTMIYNYFINGVGKIKLHLFVSVFTIFLNIPLSIFFAIVLNWGVTGIIWGTSICLLVNLSFMPYQYRKIVSKQDTGIWSK